MNYVYTFCDNMPMEESMGDRLKAARLKAGYKSARGAALAMGWPPSSYAAHENGQNDFSPDDAERYARAFKTTAGWLLTGEGSGVPRKTILLGEVGAGSVVHPFDDGGDVEWVDLPPGAPIGAGAVRVKGSSMYPRFYDGELLFYIKDDRPPQDLVNSECVIRLKDGGMLVKTLRSGSKKNVFNLESWNHELLIDKRVDWAARIRWTERR